MSGSGARVLLFVAFAFVGYINAENTFYNNGWIPVSPEKVYSQLRREFVQTSQYHRSEQQDDLKQPNNTISTLIELQSGMGIRKDVVNDKEYFVKQNELGPVTFQKKTSEINQDMIYNKESIRQAKKIAEFVVNKEINDAEKEDQESKFEQKKITQPVPSDSDSIELRNITAKLKQDSTNIYEVTENPITDDIEDQNDLTKNLELQYSAPVMNNLTSTFFDILSKYNIRAQDKLQNYQLSRLDHTQIPVKHNYRIPGLTLHTRRYNSPNHMPIDPLLAVFLSNYGVYLPGMYGIKSNYNNLYGYLASNNIHNNKPFGLYKVYSDTDSSN